MNAKSAKRGFTLVEMLVIIVIMAISLTLIIGCVSVSHEAERRASCLNNQKQIALAMQTHASNFSNAFPPSASLARAPDGNGTVGGYSFLVHLLPFMNHDPLFKTLPANGDPEDASKPAIAAAMKTQMKEFLCPDSARGDAQANGGAQPQSAGITNYKAMGATTRGSLVIVADPRANPPYGAMSVHPDGAIFPAAGRLPISQILDGMSHTILTVETVDEAASRWMVGKEATLVGLPQKSSPTGATPQPPYNYFSPPGYDGTYGENSGVTRAGLRTFLSYDFSPTGANAGKYEDPGFSKPAPVFGPSSAHPGVVNCGMCDGAVLPISKNIDAAAFFFMITKNGDDPFNPGQ